MATHPSPSRKAGVGPLQFAILRAISCGWHDIASIRKHCGQKTAGENFNDVIVGMTQRGLINPGRGRMFFLTNEAYKHLPRADALIVATRHYTPAVAPPRRPGSDHSHIPSIAAGRIYPYEAHV